MTTLPASRYYASLALPKCSLPIPQKGYVTADDVTEGKPKPGPYLAGAATLGIAPEKCRLSYYSAFTIADSDIHQAS